MIKRIFAAILVLFSSYQISFALSVTPSVSNLLCGTTQVTFTFDCAFTGSVLFTSNNPPSISYSIQTGLIHSVTTGQITFDIIATPSNAPGSFNVNFLVINTDMPGCAATTETANTNVNFNCVVPQNDVCSGAIPLNIATNSCSYSSYGTLNTTVSPIVPSCAFGGWVDLWYSFTANNATVTLDMGTAPGILGIYTLYDGSSGCGSLGAEIFCGNLVPTPATSNFTGLTVNNQYYLQILFNPAGNGTDQEICLHSTTPQPPACPNMVILSGTESGTVDTESSDWIRSDQILTSTAVIDYDAVDSIIMIPNFEVKLGAVFHAFIDGCGGSMLKEGENLIEEK